MYSLGLFCRVNPHSILIGHVNLVPLKTFELSVMTNGMQCSQFEPVEDDRDPLGLNCLSE